MPEDLVRLFDRACEIAGCRIERTYSIAGLPVRVRFAGESMFMRTGPSQAHLERQGIDDAVLTIDVWDSAADRSADPPLPRPAASAVPGAKYYFADGRVQASYMPTSGALNVFDTASSRGWYWAPDAFRMPDWEAAAPNRHLFHWWLPQHGVVELHGGAVGLADGGVLIVGRGGSGKSTTCLACLGHPDLRYASDDYTAISVGAEPWAHSLYSSGKLEPHHAKRLPHLASTAANERRLHIEEKAVFYVHEQFPKSVVDGFPLRAVVVPRIASGERDTRLVKASPAAALSALAPSTLFQLHPPTSEGFRVMADVVRRVPTFYLDLGSEIDRIPAVILQLLASRQV